MSAKNRRPSDILRDRERALEIQRCFEMIAPTSGRLVSDILSSSEDLEPLAAAIREGRLDLLELALSARHCSAPPETPDLRIMNGSGSEELKAEACRRRTAFESKFRNSPEFLKEVAKWAVYLLSTGWCVQVGDVGGEFNKGDILGFLEMSFPEAFAAIPPATNKKAHAAFWAAVGVEIEQSRGWASIEVAEKLKEIKGLIQKRNMLD